MHLVHPPTKPLNATNRGGCQADTSSAAGAESRPARCSKGLVRTPIVLSFQSPNLCIVFGEELLQGLSIGNLYVCIGSVPGLLYRRSSGRFPVITGQPAGSVLSFRSSRLLWPRRAKLVAALDRPHQHARCGVRRAAAAPRGRSTGPGRRLGDSRCAAGPHNGHA